MPTFLDDPLKRLVEGRKLAELLGVRARLVQARAKLRGDDFAAGFAELRALAGLPAAAHPVIAEAQRLLRLQTEGARATVENAGALARDYPVRTARRIEAILEVFAKDKDLVKSAKRAWSAVRKLKAWRSANAAMIALDKARKLREKGRSSAADKQLARAKRAQDIVEVREAIERYEAAGGG